jgi:hypothetical protein
MFTTTNEMEIIMDHANDSPPTPIAIEPHFSIAQVWEGTRHNIDIIAKIITVGWSVSLAFGGLIFLAYYWFINFMPEVDLKSFLTFLATSAFSGIFFLTGMLYLLVVPGILWKASVPKIKSLKDLLFKDQKLYQQSARVFLAAIAIFITLAFLGIILSAYEIAPLGC